MNAVNQKIFVILSLSEIVAAADWLEDGAFGRADGLDPGDLCWV
jgi:hypothetical protein